MCGLCAVEVLKLQMKRRCCRVDVGCRRREKGRAHGPAFIAWKAQVNQLSSTVSQLPASVWLLLHNALNVSCPASIKGCSTLSYCLYIITAKNNIPWVLVYSIYCLPGFSLVSASYTAVQCDWLLGWQSCQEPGWKDPHSTGIYWPTDMTDTSLIVW